MTGMSKIKTLAESDLTTEDIVQLKQSISYDAQRGELYWKYRDWLAQPANMHAGKPVGKDLVITLHGRRFKLRKCRVVWFFHRGRFPKRHLMPINGDWSDCRIDNLEEVSVRVIRRRRKAWGNSGVKGVCQNKLGYWNYYLRVGDKVYSGSRSTKESAVKERKELERRHLGNIR